MHTRVQASLPPQRREGRSGSVDQGESESLVIAQAERRSMLCNEDAATKVAEALGIRSYCAADILASEVRDGRITRTEAMKHIRDMHSAGIDSGKVVRGALDFTRWRTFAP
jgi:predicted nucleic acid-binding protein